MDETLDLIVRRGDGDVELCSPDVGRFTSAHSKGRVLTPGEVAGVLLTLAGSRTLRVPEGVRGVVTNDPPDLVRAPVGVHSVLYRLAPLDAAGEVAPQVEVETSLAADGLFLRSTQPGRFYRRPAPDEPAFAEPGADLTAGTAVGLIEVMKTFNRILYRATAGLPERARLVRYVAEDGAEVKEGDPLVEVEPS